MLGYGVREQILGDGTMSYVRPRGTCNPVAILQTEERREGV